MTGYRDIEFCQIADDWGSAPLGREVEPPLLVMRNGLTVEQNKEEGELRVTRIETVSDGFIAEDRVRFASGLSAEHVEKYRIRKGDILFSHINSDPHLGKTAIALKDYPDLLHGMNLLLLRANKEILLPEFLHFLCCYYRVKGVFVKICSRSVNQSSINQAKLKALEIPLPPLPEQQKIAGVLGVVQRAMEQQERLLTLTAELKKALLHKLFAEGLRGEPQKQTEIGPVPVSWEVVKLGSAVNFQTGKLNSNAAKPDGQFPFFTCSQETFWIDHYAFDTEALLLSGNNAQGIYSVKHFKGKFNAYQRTYVITLKDEDSLPYSFLHQALSRNLERLRMLSIGTSTKYLTMGVLQNLPIPKPEYDEAKSIGEKLQVVERKREYEAQKGALLTDLFRTLLHQLMAAQIRVHDLDLEGLLAQAVAEKDSKP